MEDRVARLERDIAYIRSDMCRLNAKVDGVLQSVCDLRRSITEVHSELRQSISNLRGESRESIAILRGEMREGFAKQPRER